MPNTFLATTIDLGDATSPYGSVHCRYKTEVGQRLALKALKQAYGDNTIHGGPVFASAELLEGGQIALHFNDTGEKGLEIRPMVLNANHSQGNWSGRTPFEVCMPPHPNPNNLNNPNPNNPHRNNPSPNPSDPGSRCTISPTTPPSPLRLQASAAARHALTSAAAKLLSPLTLPQLPQLLYPCSHSYCQTRRLLLTLILTLTLRIWRMH